MFNVRLTDENDNYTPISNEVFHYVTKFKRYELKYNQGNNDIDIIGYDAIESYKPTANESQKFREFIISEKKCFQNIELLADILNLREKTRILSTVIHVNSIGLFTETILNDFEEVLKAVERFLIKYGFPELVTKNNSDCAFYSFVRFSDKLSNVVYADWTGLNAESQKQIMAVSETRFAEGHLQATERAAKIIDWNEKSINNLISVGLVINTIVELKNGKAKYQQYVTDIFQVGFYQVLLCLEQGGLKVCKGCGKHFTLKKGQRASKLYCDEAGCNRKKAYYDKNK